MTAWRYEKGNDSNKVLKVLSKNMTRDVWYQWAWNRRWDESILSSMEVWPGFKAKQATREHYQIGEDDRSNGAWAWDPAENRDKEDKEIKKRAFSLRRRSISLHPSLEVTRTSLQWTLLMHLQKVRRPQNEQIVDPLLRGRVATERKTASHFNRAGQTCTFYPRSPWWHGGKNMSTP